MQKPHAFFEYIGEWVHSNGMFKGRIEIKDKYLFELSKGEQQSFEAMGGSFIRHESSCPPCPRIVAFSFTVYLDRCYLINRWTIESWGSGDIFAL